MAFITVYAIPIATPTGGSAAVTAAIAPAATTAPNTPNAIFFQVFFFF